MSRTGEAEIVSYDYHRGSLFGSEFAEHGHELLARLGVEFAGRFVGQNHFGLSKEGSGKGDSLGLTAGELVGSMVDPIFQSDAFQQVSGSLAIGGRDAGGDAGDQYVVECGELWEKITGLEDEPDPFASEVGAFGRVEGGQISTVELDSPGGGAIQGSSKMQ